MNEHMWKKLGEVKAFALVAVSFLKKAEDGLEEDVFSAEEIAKLVRTNEAHIDKIDTIASEHESADIVDKKAEKTVEKLRGMQDSYLADEDDWEDPMELLEWSGFFFGGAVVHWSVISGAGESAENNDLSKLAETGLDFHHQMLHASKDAIKTLAASEA